MKKEENYMAEEVKKEEPQKVKTSKDETTSTNAVLKAADEKKEKKSKATFVRLLVMIVVFLVLGGVGISSGVFALSDLSDIVFDFSAIWKVLIMMASVITLETLIVFLLGLPKLKSHRARSVISVISSLMKYIAAIVILCWGLSILGVNVSTIVASVGIVALIVGFSAESLIADVVTGAFMIFENHYNVGDIIEVDGFRGTVTDIGIRTTCITDPAQNIKIVNNSAMKNILNRSDKMSRSISDIGIPYGTDLENLEAAIPALMQEIYDKHRDMMKDLPKYLGVNELGDSAVVLRFMVYVDESDIFAATRVLNHDLLLGFRKLGVEVPFPQRDVHLYQ
jgi:small conductance mechanosensitive channel